ncbi:probable protein phosphatase 2C 46 isoform X2 [Daucus carota subsp. sativus]|uniref:probable protein phosphatase 2C 46 isoform X2 n=1 Tax=Daucus carota subsp. sativus TaxID=79200 RepID=UPI0007F011EC|nr:PREDICTED: probable protein phosphatase 2C 46 isoform X2 [Daucus carota subsp. sativus]
MVRPCWKPSSEGDKLLWHKDLGSHVSGEFSMAVIQANSLLEDQSQLVSGPLSSLNSGTLGTFIGVYDGHGGPETSRFVNDKLFPNFKIKKAFMATEEDFLSSVREQWHTKPQLAAVGTCCLVGIICDGLLYVANAGDSRVVLGRADRSATGITAVQLSRDHNVNIASERDELHSLHPADSHIVVLKHNVWRVKGIIQISRSIGDAYLKKAEFNREPLLAKFRLPAPFKKPILSAEPSTSTHKLNSKDRFLIFASDGLWEQLSNQEVVDIVHNYPRNGIARRLIKVALHVAARKREMRYSDLQNIDRGVRRHFHDDITVIAVFLDPQVTNARNICSIRAGGVAPATQF